MHKFIESYVTGVGYDDLTELGQEAKPMAEKVIEIGLAPVEEYYGSEVTLYYPGLYAGSTDLVCNHNGLESIVDFKQSNRPKRKEWVEDYFLQIASICHGSRLCPWFTDPSRCNHDVYTRLILSRISDHGP